MTEEQVARHAALETLVLCLLGEIALHADDPEGLIERVIDKAHAALDGGTVLADTPEAADRVRQFTHREIARLGRSLSLPPRRSP